MSFIRSGKTISEEGKTVSRVVVVGSSNTDMTVRLPSLPAAGQTVLGETFLISGGGKGANQAIAARRAGAEVVFVAAVGDDDLGRRSLALYKEEGINVDFVRIVAGVPSGVALIFVSRDGENMIGVAPGANQQLSPADIDRLPDSVFRPGDVLLAGLEIPISTAIRAMRRGKSSGMTVILNPAPAPSLSEDEVCLLLSVADIITPNRVEAMMLVGIRGGERPEPSLCARRLLALGPRAIVITLAADGCLVAQGETFQMVPSPRVLAVDAVGAGDAYSGALAVALGESRSLVEAAGWAARAAALAVTKPGAQTGLPFRQEIEQFVAGY
jgi:ribokinase